jgi:hypothetical protein
VKILYVTDARRPDYLNDLVFHGLYSLFGNDVVDSRCLEYMYRQYTPPRKQKKLYGRGFTVYATLERDDIDRSDLRRKIERRHFDLVVYGSVHRCVDYLDAVLGAYPRNEIVLLDGEDAAWTASSFFGGFPLFKRELVEKREGLFPISFSIPKEKIAGARPAKDKRFGRCIPGNKKTYVFKTEAAYYADYGRSHYGITMRKGGWDCLRHYEILANHCLPYFEGLEQCPPETLASFPKALCLEARALADAEKAGAVFDEARYGELLDAAMRHLHAHLTTEAVARYLVDSVKGLA